ncbi:helix-turn-helix transcriptional regulator [Streptomyces sp. NPDC026672]|uniref:helix-turn-helix domain-containing protein n=1 Tax=unclassified Streptomyces TaxID=2593676 RepID=UPI0034116166
MTNVNVLDPGASPLDYYGSELRRFREVAGLTQRQLGGVLNYTGSLVGQIETARKLPTVEFSQRADAALETGGSLSRLMELVFRSQLPSWFRVTAELEARATEICAFQMGMVHGLLQTPAYIRAVLGAFDQPTLEDQAAARLARQRILHEEERPVFWMVLSEAALYQEIGDRDIMRGQLAHLASFEGDNRVNVQVLPFSAGAHPGLTGPFDIYRFQTDPAIAYTEGYEKGHPTADSNTVTSCSLRYDHLQAAALSIKDSAELMRHMAEEYYGDGEQAA